MESAPLLLIGVGNVARTVASCLVGKSKIYGTTRDPLKIFDLWQAQLEPVVMPYPQPEVIRPLASGANVLISFPPDGKTDALLAPACSQARSIVYISSTSVYGNLSGAIDDSSPADLDNANTAPRLEAEQIWRSIGATVLRPAAIYGANSGLHIRLRNGDFKLPGDGSGTVSRIHVEDLASVILAAFDNQHRGDTYVIGDLEPATHLAVTEWLCSKLQLPLPERIPLNQTPQTLRGNRSIDASRALTDFQIALKYPTYREGFAACLADSEQSELT